MKGLQSEVIGNFNNFLKEQKELEGKAKLTLVLFDDQYEMIYDEVDLQKAKPLTKRQYFARGMTRMNDAVGKTLVNKGRKKKAIVLIHTDGDENDSREYDHSDIKKIVKKLKKKWEFIFVGAGIDAKQRNRDYGFTHTLNANNNSRSYANQYDLFSNVSTGYRAGAAVNCSATVAMVQDANLNEEDSNIGGILDVSGNTITTNTTLDVDIAGK
jgi:uncharacterized protein YegL